MYELEDPDSDLPIEKRTRVISTSPKLAANLGRRCDQHDHDSTWSTGVCTEARNHNTPFLRAVLKGLRETWARIEPSRLKRLRWTLLSKLQDEKAVSGHDIGLLEALDRECSSSACLETAVDDDFACPPCGSAYWNFPNQPG